MPAAGPGAPIGGAQPLPGRPALVLGEEQLLLAAAVRRSRRSRRSRRPVLALLAVAFAIHLRVGTVVRVHDAERDHWSRTSPPAMLCLVLEGMVASSSWTTRGPPMAFDHFETAGTARSGLPANLEPLTVAQPTDAPG